MPGPIEPEQIRKIDRFPVVRFIAAGGQAWVFEVEDPQKFNDRYALKLLKPDAAAGTDLVRFEDETRFQMTIKHPNLLRVYERGQDEETGCLYYVMDLLTLGTLAEVRITDPEATVTSSALTASVTMVCKYVCGALAGLAHIHREGLIHRDIKPANIFIDQGDVAKLGDLGIAKRTGQAGVTERGYAPGTILYMSPEQVTGAELGPPSDIFAMGLALYRVLTGRTIYEEVKELDSTNSNAVQQHLWELQRTGDAFVYEFPPRVPEPIREVVRKACAIRLEDRYQTADEMRGALERAVFRVEAASTGMHLAEPRGASRGMKLAVAAVLLVALAGGGFFGWRWYQQSQVLGEMRQALRRGTATGLRVAEITGVVQAAGGSPGLVDDAKALKSDGDESLLNAKRFIEAGSPQFAGLELEEARKTYATACTQLSKEHLEPATAEQTAAALAAIAAVHPSAQEYQAERWQALQDWKQRLAAPVEASGCAGSQGLVARAEDAGRAKSAAAGIEVAMRDQLPRIAESEIDAAGQAGEAARAVASPFAAYKQAMGRGDASVEQARTSLGAARNSGAPEEFEASMAASTSAKESYQAATDAAGAFEQRAEAQQLVADARQVGITIGVYARALDGAEAAFRKQEWGEAREGFGSLTRNIGSTLEDSKPARGALTTARNARVAAIRAGVPSAELADADELLRAGTGRIKAGKFAEAESTLERAREFYEAEQKTLLAQGAVTEQQRTSAATAISRAIEDQKLARASDGEGAEYVAALGQGDDALKRARGLSRSRKYAGVPALAGEASDAFGEAARIAPAHKARQSALRREADASGAGLGEPLWDVDAKMASQTWADGNWQTAQREYERMDQRLADLLNQAKPAVAASQQATAKRKAIPDNDETALDGDAESEQGRDALRRGDFDAALGHFDAATGHYARFVPNRRPKLVLTPGGKSKQIVVGESVAFRATVSDPDGDKVEVRFDVDGKTAKLGTRYTFKPDAPGTYTVKAVATDGRRPTSATRTIVVKPKAAVVARVEPKTAPRVAAPKLATPTATQPAGVPDKVEKFLEEYRRAFERKDMSALRSMRVMDDDEVGDVENMFWDCEDLKLEFSYDKSSIQVSDGKKAQMEFTQTRRGCMLTDGAKDRFSASLWQRGGGDWKMRLSRAQ
ncbi:MAG: protein kinase [Deltaproteobacteria bacterium]|nr:protein kinase [Deltaproteobacteria bacterium]